MTTLFPTYIDDKALAQDLILSQFDNFLIVVMVLFGYRNNYYLKSTNFYNFLLE